MYKEGLDLAVVSLEFSGVCLEDDRLEKLRVSFFFGRLPRKVGLLSEPVLGPSKVLLLSKEGLVKAIPSPLPYLQWLQVGLRGSLPRNSSQLLYIYHYWLMEESGFNGSNQANIQSPHNRIWHQLSIVIVNQFLWINESWWDATQTGRMCTLNLIQGVEVQQCFMKQVILQTLPTGESSQFNTLSYQRPHLQSGCNLRSLLTRWIPDRYPENTVINPDESQPQSGLPNDITVRCKDYHISSVVTVNILQPQVTSKIRMANLIKSIGSSCPSAFRSSQLCECENSCRWGVKWSRWSHRPQDYQLYETLAKTPTKIGMLTQIQKDMKRTQPQNAGYRLFHNKKMLQEVLQIYSKYDKQLQYIQGMNMIVSVILYHVNNPKLTFWVFVDIMQRREFRQIYVDNFKTLPRHTSAVNALIQQHLPELHRHFQLTTVQFELISTGWLLSLLFTLVPLEHAHLVLDMFIEDGWTALYHIILSYLRYLQPILLEKTDPSDLLSYFSPSLREESTDWDLILCKDVVYLGLRLL